MSQINRRGFFGFIASLAALQKALAEAQSAARMPLFTGVDLGRGSMTKVSLLDPGTGEWLEVGDVGPEVLIDAPYSRQRAEAGLPYLRPCDLCHSGPCVTEQVIRVDCDDPDATLWREPIAGDLVPDWRLDGA